MTKYAHILVFLFFSLWFYLPSSWAKPHNSSFDSHTISWNDCKNLMQDVSSLKEYWDAKIHQPHPDAFYLTNSQHIIRHAHDFGHFTLPNALLPIIHSAVQNPLNSTVRQRVKTVCGNNQYSNIVLQLQQFDAREKTHFANFWFI